MNADKALSLLGKYNKWQMQKYCLLAFGFGVPFAWMIMSIVFIGKCTYPERCGLLSNIFDVFSSCNEILVFKGLSNIHILRKNLKLAVWCTITDIPLYEGDTPKYRCALPPNATLNETIPSRVTEEGKLEYEKCSMYVNLSVDNTTVPCQYGYWYDPASGYESTLTTEVGRHPHTQTLYIMHMGRKTQTHSSLVIRNILLPVHHCIPYLGMHYYSRSARAD